MYYILFGMEGNMSQDAIREFAAEVRSDQQYLERLKALKSASEVTSFASSMGHEFDEESVSAFVEETARQTPTEVKEKIIASGTPLHFDEESIIRFAAKRLQIDSDY